MVIGEGAEPAGTSVEGDRPLSWRIPPYQPALLILLTTGCAAWAIYGHPAAGLRFILSVIGVLLFVLALLTLRMHFIVDDDGIAVRFVRAEQWIEWPEISSVRIVNGVRGAQTLRVERVDRSYVDVPPSLLMSARPITKPTAEAMLRATAAAVSARRTAPPREP